MLKSRNGFCIEFMKSNSDALRDLPPIIKLKKREKHPWRSGVLLLGPAAISTSPWVFFTFLKLCKWYQIAQITTIGVVWLFLLLTLTRPVHNI